MDDSHKELENQLADLIPRNLSDSGRKRCHDTIDELARGSVIAKADIAAPNTSPVGLSWKATGIAASVALGLGLAGGWHLGHDDPQLVSTQTSQDKGEIDLFAYEVLDREYLLTTEGQPDVYISDSGEVRERFREVAVTKETVKHLDSDTVVVVETIENHMVDTPKSEF